MTRYLQPFADNSLFDPNQPVRVFVLSFLATIVLFGYFVPISLYVSLEIVRIFQALFINRDREMRDPSTKQWAAARTSNLNEELGMVILLIKIYEYYVIPSVHAYMIVD